MIEEAIAEITTIDEIVTLAKSGFTNWGQYGCVSTKRLDDLILFNYTTHAQYKNGWNFFERVSRGLIIDTVTGEIVARPFDKFFNWGEGGRTSTEQIVSVTSKMDGSLGILYRHNGKYRIATRGSFDSTQALWATQHWHKEYPHVFVPEELTLMFEIIYPENRIVVDYGREEALVLIGARNRFTGEFLSMRHMDKLADILGFKIPHQWLGFDVDDIKERLPHMTNAEGFVVEFADGQRFKFKAEEYLRLHKLVFSLSFKATLKAKATGFINEFIGAIPDEFLEDVLRWDAQIQATVEQVRANALSAFAQAPKESRRAFAEWVQANHPRLKHYLFALLDGKDIDPIIYTKHDFVEG